MNPPTVTYLALFINVHGQEGWLKEFLTSLHDYVQSMGYDPAQANKDVDYITDFLADAEPFTTGLVYQDQSRGIRVEISRWDEPPLSVSQYVGKMRMAQRVVAVAQVKSDTKEGRNDSIDFWEAWHDGFAFADNACRSKDDKPFKHIFYGITDNGQGEKEYHYNLRVKYTSKWESVYDNVKFALF